MFRISNMRRDPESPRDRLYIAGGDPSMVEAATLYLGGESLVVDRSKVRARLRRGHHARRVGLEVERAGLRGRRRGRLTGAGYAFAERMEIKPDQSYVMRLKISNGYDLQSIMIGQRSYGIG